MGNSDDRMALEFEPSALGMNAADNHWVDNNSHVGKVADSVVDMVAVAIEFEKAIELTWELEARRWLDAEEN